MTKRWTPALSGASRRWSPGRDDRVRAAVIKAASTDKPFDTGHVLANLTVQDYQSERAVEKIVRKYAIETGEVVEILDPVGRLWVSRTGARKLQGNPRYKVFRPVPEGPGGGKVRG